MKIDLVLGSGAARGVAHIGVLRELEARGHQPMRIRATSMGAMVGGAWATGTLDALEAEARALRWWTLPRHLSPSFSTRGLVGARGLRRLLDGLWGSTRIEELPLPFAAITSDLATGTTVELTRGSLTEAVRASTAIPGAFVPQLHRGPGGRLRHALADGTLTAPLPVPAERHPEAEALVVVSVMGSGQEPWARPPRLLRHLPGITVATFDIMLRTIETQVLADAPEHVLVSVPPAAGSTLEFHRLDRVIEAGRAETARTLDAAGL